MSVTLPESFGRNVTVPSSAISTPLIFLSPRDARLVNITTYLHVVSTGIYIWDILNNLRNDFKLLSRRKFGVPTVLYFAIRLSLLLYSIGRAVLLTAPVENCGELAHIVNIFLGICVGSSTTFFYLRMVAVYNRNKFIVTFFGITWLATLAMAVLSAMTFSATPIENTDYCQEIIVRPNYLLLTVTFIWSNDFLIYLAIAHRIYRIFSDYDFEGGLQRRLIILLFGASLPVGSKIVLLESQLSCFVIVASKFFLVVGLAINEDRIYMFLICHLVLVAILASRIYRDLRGVNENGHSVAANTEFRTANLTSVEFRGVARTIQDHDRKMRALDEESSNRESIIPTNPHGSIPNFGSNRISAYSGNELENLNMPSPPQQSAQGSMLKGTKEVSTFDISGDIDMHARRFVDGSLNNQ